MRVPPITFTWHGDAMIPRGRFAKLCDKAFVVGVDYPLVIEEPRSRASHNHYFAAIEEGWKNLPENIANEFPTSEHLRKYALISAGFCDRRSIVCRSKAEAQRLAAFIKPMDDFAVVTPTECVVTVYTAQSQSVRAMGKEAFQKSKTAVLDIIAGMVKVDRGTLEQEAGRAA